MPRPIIGVTCSVDGPGEGEQSPRGYVNLPYLDAVYAAGGMPQPVPVLPTAEPAALDELLARYDGLLFTGGDDLNPRHYGQAAHPKTGPMHERRDRFEVEFFRRADASGKPILSICLGCQIAGAARGGCLIQHVDDLDAGANNEVVAAYAAGDIAVRAGLDSQITAVGGRATRDDTAEGDRATRDDTAEGDRATRSDTAEGGRVTGAGVARQMDPARVCVVHHLSDHRSAYHDVEIVPDSLLARIVGRTRIEVNSRHHQVVDPANLGGALRPVAFAPDGVVEAVEDASKRFFLAVQWHAEDLIDRPEQLRLFEALVKACRG